MHSSIQEWERWNGTRTIVFCCRRQIVGRELVGTTINFNGITNAVFIGICKARSSALSNGVNDITVTITIAFWHFFTTAIINRAWSIAQAASIQFTDAIIGVIANSVCVRICRTSSSTDAQGVQLVSIAIAITLGNIGATALVNFSRAIAYVAGIKSAYTRVNIIANTIVIGIYKARSSAFSRGINLVAVAIAITFGDAFSTANSAFIINISVAIAITFWDLIASTGVNFAGAIAHSAII
jgi:hypothetical protein